MNGIFLLVVLFILLPLAGALGGLWLARPAVLSGKLALALAFVPVAGVGLAQVFC